MIIDDEEREEEIEDEQEEDGRNTARKYIKSIGLAVAFALTLAVGFIGGIAVNAKTANSVIANVPGLGDSLSATPDSSANLADFWKVWNILQSQYVVTHASSTLPTTDDKLWGAIEGLTASYGDPYTVFFPPAQAKVFQSDIAGNFSGVGIEMGVNKDNVLTVIAPLKGTPADKAGMLPGDEIVAIDGKTTEGMSTDAAVDAIRGPKGTVVTFTIVRDGAQKTIKVTRDTINVPEIENGLNQKTGVYNIALYTFTENSADLFNTAFTAFKASGSKKLVIDLRGNPGGYLDQAVAIASHFLPSGTTVVTEDYEGKQANIVHRSTGIGDLPAGTKVVVLIDAGSASASEILSGALQDNHAATLIGTKSFGKGSVQELINIDGGSLKVTVARWLTPNGHSIMGNGIIPDILVNRTQDDVDAGKDPQMDRAVQFLTTGK